MKLGGLVLAAGKSSRMGEFKPLQRLHDRALLQATIDSLLVGGCDLVTVVLGHRAEELTGLLHTWYPTQQVQAVYNDAYAQTDMLASIRIGLPSLMQCDAFYVLPGDMPAVLPSTLRSLAFAMANSHAEVAFPLLDGRRKHPPLIRTTCVPTILGYQGQDGLRGVWATYYGRIVDVPTTDIGCGLDADTIEEFAQLTQVMAHRDQMRLTENAPDGDNGSGGGLL